MKATWPTPIAHPHSAPTWPAPAAARRPGTDMAAWRDPAFVHKAAVSPAARHLLALGLLAVHIAAGWALLQAGPVRQVVVQGAPVFVRLMTSEAPHDLPPVQPERPIPPLPRRTAAETPSPSVDDPSSPPPPPSWSAAHAPQVEPAPGVQPLALAGAEPLEPRVPAASPALPSTPSTPPAPRAVAPDAVRYLVHPQPAYPTVSRRLGEHGEVLLRVEIGTDGRPRHVLLHRSSGFTRLDESAITAMRTVRFAPYVEHGVAWIVWTIVPIVFELQG